MPLAPVIPVLSLAIPGLSLIIPGLSLFVPNQFQDVLSSSCLMFYWQYNHSYNKLNLPGTIIRYKFQKSDPRELFSLCVNNVRKVIYKKEKENTEVKKCMLIF